MHDFFYRPEGAWAADFIPYFDGEQYRLFYLWDARDVEHCGEGTPWYQITTRDFVNFTELGEALPRGARDEPDLYVFTGSVIEALGRKHIFYTAHNPHLRPIQGICHAVSDDWLDWRPLPEPIFYAPEQYEPDDWRDPFVFYSPNRSEYCMLVVGRRREGPSRRRGCTVLCTSADLVHWQVREDFYSPGLYHTHECPDLFRLGDWWYLLFSTYSEQFATHYRMARSPEGPWLTPEDDMLDGRAFYAAKTAGDGKHRYLFGWNPTRSGDSDQGGWQWGGNLVVHTLYSRPDGTLAVGPPPSVLDAFSSAQPVEWQQGWGPWEGLSARTEGFACKAAPLPRRCRIDATVTFAPGTRGVGVGLHLDEANNGGCYYRLEPGKNRVTFDIYPQQGEGTPMPGLERPLSMSPDVPHTLQILVEDSLCVLYLDGEVALNARMYERSGRFWGLFVQQGAAVFRDVALYTIP